MVYFREVQRLWSWVLLVVVISIPAVIIARTVSRFPGQAPSDRILYVVCAPLALTAVWFSLGRLVTEVRESALSIHFHLLWPERQILWSEIRRAEATTYSGMSFGVRMGARGTIYNVSGSRAVSIELAGGETVLLGSQRAFELAQAITDRLKPLP